MRVPKPFVWLLAIALIGVGTAALWQSYESLPPSAPSQGEWTSTPTGPIGPADRDLIVRVHQASLWEHPLGQQMAERGQLPRVREVGSLLSEEHLKLDKLDVDVARELGVDLPTQPSAQQQDWLAQTSAASDADFDTMSVNFLRKAHGVVLPLLATVRSSTQNSSVREFAEKAEAFVQRHMGYLESTNLVKFDTLSTTPLSTRSTVMTTAALFALGAVLVLIGGSLLVVSVMRHRRARHLPERPRRELKSPGNTMYGQESS